MVGLREHVFVVLARNVYCHSVSVFKPSVREGKPLARYTQLIFYLSAAKAYLIFQFLAVIRIYHVVIHGVRPDDVSPVVQIFYRVPAHGLFSRSQNNVLGKIAYVGFITVNKVGIDEKSRIHSEILQYGGNEVDTVRETVIKSKRHYWAIRNLSFPNHFHGVFNMDEFAFFCKFFQQAMKMLLCIGVYRVAIYHVPI